MWLPGWPRGPRAAVSEDYLDRRGIVNNRSAAGRQNQEKMPLRKPDAAVFLILVTALLSTPADAQTRTQPCQMLGRLVREVGLEFMGFDLRVF
jgi:hypothetical protein